MEAIGSCRNCFRASFPGCPFFGVGGRREYAEEKLTPEECISLKDRHRDYFLTLAEAEEVFFSPQQKSWLDRLQQEHDNLRAALEHCLEEDGRDAAKALRLVAGLVHFWLTAGIGARDALTVNVR